MNPERIRRGEFVEPTDATEPCRDGIGNRIGVVLEIAPMPEDNPAAYTAMIYWFCCKRTMIGDLRYCRLLPTEKAQRAVWGDD